VKIRKNGEAHPVVLVYNVLGGNLIVELQWSVDTRLRGNDIFVFDGRKVRIDVSFFHTKKILNTPKTILK